MSKKSIDSIDVSDYNKAVFTGRTLSNQTKTVPLVSPKGVGRGREAASRATVRDLIDRIAIAGSKAISTSLSRASTLAQQQNNNDISLGLNCRADPSAGRLELTDLNSIRTLWLKKVQLLGEMKNAVTSWKNWNEQIRKFYDDGLISALGDQILDVKYKNPNDPTYEISIGDKNLEGTFRFIHGRQLYGEEGLYADSLKAANNKKDSASSKGEHAASVIVDACRRNTAWANELLGQISTRKGNYLEVIAMANAGIQRIESTQRSIYIRPMVKPSTNPNEVDPNSLNPRSTAGG